MNPGGSGSTLAASAEEAEGGGERGSSVVHHGTRSKALTLVIAGAPVAEVDWKRAPQYRGWGAAGCRPRQSAARGAKRSRKPFRSRSILPSSARAQIGRASCRERV